jgi:hypothetical protein
LLVQLYCFGTVVGEDIGYGDAGGTCGENFEVDGVVVDEEEVCEAAWERGFGVVGGDAW